jgi:hypothetical protein
MAKSIVGIGIAKSNDRVYTWFNDGTVTQGDSGNLQKYGMRRARSYQVPGGSPLDIVAMSIAGNDHVYTWYTDGTRSVGTSTNLGAYQGRQSVNLHGKSMSDVVGIGIAGSNDHVYIWYNDQTRSVGTSQDFQAYQTPQHYDLFNDPLKPGIALTPLDIVEIDITKTDLVHTWFRNGIHATGSSIQLGKTDVGAYIRSHVLYNFLGRNRTPSILQGSGAPANGGGIPPATTYCGSHDAMAAISPNFIAISDTTWLKFIERGTGKVLDLGTAGQDPINPNDSCSGLISGKKFFSAFFDPNRDVYVNNNVGFRRQCDDPNFPATNNTDESGVDRKFCITGKDNASLYDVRVIFDAVSKHFFITAQVRNGGFFPRTAADDSPPSWACAHFHHPDGSVAWTGDPEICSMPRHHKLLAVSKDEDPRDGFHEYLVTENTIADWPLIGVNGSRVVLSNGGDMEEPPIWPAEVGVVQVFNLDAVATGKLHPPYFEYFPNDLDGLGAATPPVHHGNTQGLTFLVAKPGRLAIFGMPDAPDPWVAPSLLVTHEFGTSQKGPDPGGSVYRNGILYFVDATHSAKSGPLPDGSTVQNGVRVVSVHVHKNGQILDSSVDLDETFDPDDTSISFDDPSIDVNRNGTILIGYHAELRDWHVPRSVARARVWAFGHPSDTDLLVTPGVDVSGSTCKQPCRQKNDYTTTVVDPADDVGFWTALPYTDTVSVRTSITKVPAP